MRAVVDKLPVIFLFPGLFDDPAVAEADELVEACIGVTLSFGAADEIAVDIDL